MNNMFQLYEFGAFRLNAQTGELTRDGVPMPAGGRALRVLAALLARPGELVTKEELMQAGWPGMLVEDNNVTVQISHLRRLLDDERKPHRRIVTVQRRGYRFDGEMRRPDIALDVQFSTSILPPQATRHQELFGRERELARVHASLARHRLVTLTGTGGIGKTRLAAEFAAEFLADRANRLVFLPLEDVRQGTEVAARLAAALDVPAGAAPERALIAALRRRGDVLVLDNCEHVLADVAALVVAILAKTERTKILATSREPLGVPGEFLLPLGPLELPARDAARPAMTLADYAAVKIFAAAAQSRGATLDLNEATAGPVEKICRRLDGIPLALKLAGARLATDTLAAIEQSLAAQWRLPSALREALPARQRTMEAAIDWSVALLDPPSQIFLRRLGVFAGSFSVPAAQALAPDGVSGAAAAAMLDALVAKSLVVLLPGLTTSRFRLLEPVRDYTRRHLGEAEERGCRLKLLDYFGAFYEQSLDDYRFMNTVDWISRYGDDQDNVVDGLNWALLGDGVGLPGVVAPALHLHYAVWALFQERPLGTAVNQWASAALALLSDHLPPLQKARTLLQQSADRQVVGSGRKEGLTREAVGIFRRLGDRGGLGQALCTLAAALIDPADVGPAEQCLAEAETHLRAVQNHRAIATCLGFRSVCRQTAGDLPAAERLAAECLAAARDIGCRRIMLEAGTWQVTLAFLAGRRVEAIRLARARIAECRAHRQTMVQFYMIQSLMGFLLQNDEPDAVIALLPEALDCYAGNFLESFPGYVATALAMRGGWRDAARLMGFTEAWRRKLDLKSIDPPEHWSDETGKRLLAEAVDAETQAAWRGEGALWDEDEVLAYLRGIADGIRGAAP